jgi:hypothetical protein
VCELLLETDVSKIIRKLCVQAANDCQTIKFDTIAVRLVPEAVALSLLLEHQPQDILNCALIIEDVRMMVLQDQNLMLFALVILKYEHR